MSTDTPIIDSAYRTILAPARIEIVVHKSRFVGFALPAHSEEDALRSIRDTKKAFRTATHYCYAYVIGANAGIMRYSDDGEPSGTAGLPIMGVLQNNGIVNICAMVVRYFGGTLLGTGGLVRAYGGACALAVEKAKIVVMEPTRRMTVLIPYPMWGKVQHALNTSSIVLTEETTYGISVVVTLLVRDENIGAVSISLQNLLNQTVDYELSDIFMYHWPPAED